MLFSHKNSLIGTVLSLAYCVLALSFATASGQGNPQPRDTGWETKSNSLQKLVTKTVDEQNLPGLIAAIADSNGIVAIAAAGVRKVGSDQALQTDDLIHIGSCTKAMTSTMLATLVQDGVLSWDTTLLDVFPELKGDIHPGYHAVTLGQLVRHRGRIPANASNWWAYPDLDLMERRLEIVKQNLRNAPDIEPGDYKYSNLGYVVAGCLAEKKTGKSWETLMQERLFEPLGMASAGFGPPGSAESVAQPWGHLKNSDRWVARHADNAAALGPAGRVHCSLADWAKFIALQLPGDDKPILNANSLKQLIEPRGNYAAGWGVYPRSWARGLALTHNGSNTMWFATVWVAPGINRAYLVATNSADDNSPQICDQIVSQLIEEITNR